jgi:tetratricopeptide (TPR) repeat protein
MRGKYFNWKLAAVLVIGVIVLGVTAFTLRKWQRSRLAYGALERGNKAFDECRWEEAAKELGGYIGLHQEDVPVLLKYAEAHLNIRPLKQNNLLQSIQAYRIVLRVDEDNIEATERLMEMYIQMNSPGEAELIAARTLETNPTPQLKIKLAVALLAQRKYDEATQVLNDIIKENPEQIAAYELLARLSEQQGDTSRNAQYWFDEAVKNNPSSASAYIVRASYYIRKDEKDTALIDLTRAAEQDLSDPTVRLRLVGWYIIANLFEEARTHLTAVKDEDPTNQNLWNTWARLALKSQSPEEMIMVAETGLRELDSQPWDFMPLATELYIRAGKLESARQCIAQMQKKEINPARTAFLDGLLAERGGDNYRAIRCWREALQLAAKSEKLLLALSPKLRLGLASVLSRTGDRFSAVKELRTLVSEQPNNYLARLNLTKLLFESGNWTEASEQAHALMQLASTLDANLLYLQTQMQLLVKNKTAPDSPMWQQLKESLDELQEASEDTLGIDLVQFQLAIFQQRYGDAQKIVDNLKTLHPSELRVVMAEVELLTVRDETDQAVQALEKIIESFPQLAQPVKVLALLLAASDKSKQCEEVLKNAITRIEQPILKRELGLLLSGFYRRWNQDEENRRLLNELSEELPNDPYIKRRLLHDPTVLADVEKAQEIVEEIKQIEGDSGWQWRYEQARLLSVQDDFEDKYPQAVSLLKENLLANPDDQNSRLLLARSYERAGQLQLAVSTYRQALDRSPDDIRIIIPAVAALNKANEYDLADEILQRAAQQEMSSPLLQKLQLQSYQRRGELSSAEDVLEEFIADDPENLSDRLTLALLKIKQNKFDEADTLLNELKAKRPDSIQVTAAQIDLNIRQNDTDSALQLCNDTIDSLNNAEAYILRARTYTAIGQTENATKDFEKAVEIEPDNDKAWTAKSDFHRSMRQSDTALKDIRKALALSPNDLAVQKRTISLLLGSSDRNSIDEGKRILENALSESPEDPRLRLNKARLLIAEATAPALQEAEEILKKITEDTPMFAEAWIVSAEVALRQEQLGKANDIAMRGLIYRPRDKQLLLQKARAEAARSPALAIPTLRALHDDYPDDAEILTSLANVFVDAEQAQRAVEVLQQRLPSFVDTADEQTIRIVLAVALYKANDKTEAQNHFQLLLEAAPDDPRPLLAYCRLLADDKSWDEFIQEVSDWYKNRPDEIRIPIAVAAIAGDVVKKTGDRQALNAAEKILQMVLENNSDCTEAMAPLAMLMQMAGRVQESAALYRRVIELQPNNVVALNNLAWIMCEHEGQYEQALQLAQQGLKTAPNYIDLIDTRGFIYYKLGQYDKAVQDFTECIKLYSENNPGKTNSYFHLATALVKLDEKSDAVDALNIALELNNKTGGLSPEDTNRAQTLLNELSQGV